MKSKKLENHAVYDFSVVKYTKMGNITQVLSLAHKNNSCAIKKLNKNEYIKLETGEIVECKHIENRSENINTIRQSISKLRNIINCNFVGAKNELWITLTFGENKVYNANDLCSIFEKFIKRLRYKYKEKQIDYIYIPEPHEKGDWHIHLLLKADSKLFIANEELRELWGQGFVKVNRLEDVDNVGAYVSAYLINIKDGEETKKGARLKLYPANHKLYRCSKGIEIPKSEYITYSEAKNRIGNAKLTYKNTVCIETETGFKNTIHTEFYNDKRK